jgi:hypothetical protein
MKEHKIRACLPPLKIECTPMMLEMIKLGQIKITDTPDFDVFIEAISGIESAEDLLSKVNS